MEEFLIQFIITIGVLFSFIIVLFNGSCGSKPVDVVESSKQIKQQSQVQRSQSQHVAQQQQNQQQEFSEIKKEVVSYVRERPNVAELSSEISYEENQNNYNKKGVFRNNRQEQNLTIIEEISGETITTSNRPPSQISFNQTDMDMKTPDFIEKQWTNLKSTTLITNEGLQNSSNHSKSAQETKHHSLKLKFHDWNRNIEIGDDN